MAEMLNCSVNEGATLYRHYQFDGERIYADGVRQAYTRPELSVAIGTVGGVLSGAQGVTIVAREVRNVDTTADSAAHIVAQVQLASGGTPSAGGPVDAASASAANAAATTRADAATGQAASAASGQAPATSLGGAVDRATGQTVGTNEGSVAGPAPAEPAIGTKAETAGAARGIGAVAALPNSAVPILTGGLYTLRPEPGSSYLYETRPAFAGGAPGNDLGQYGGERLANDPAYRVQVNQSIAVLNACNASPASCTQQAIKAAALVVFPLMGVAGVAITVEGAVVGGAIGAVANAGGQVYANHGDATQINPVDVSMAALTGVLTYGATLWPSLFINTGGALVTSAVNNASPSGATGSITGAALGTAIGYPVGTAIQSVANGAVNPWYRPLWQDMGLTIQQWIQPSVIPGVAGTIGGGAMQESGNALVNGQTPVTVEHPTRGGK